MFDHDGFDRPVGDELASAQPGERGTDPEASGQLTDRDRTAVGARFIEQDENFLRQRARHAQTPRGTVEAWPNRCEDAACSARPSVSTRQMHRRSAPNVVVAAQKRLDVASWDERGC